MFLTSMSSLLGARVLGHSLGSFTHSVLGQLAGKKQPDSCLYFPRRDGRTLVVVSQTRSFGGDPLENVVDEAVHDAHGFRGNSRIGMDLLQHLVNVDGVGFLPLTLLLLVSLGDVLLSLAGFLDCFPACFRWHG